MPAKRIVLSVVACLLAFASPTSGDVGTFQPTLTLERPAVRRGERFTFAWTVSDGEEEVRVAGFSANEIERISTSVDALERSLTSMRGLRDASAEALSTLRAVRARLSQTVEAGSTSEERLKLLKRYPSSHPGMYETVLDYEPAEPIGTIQLSLMPLATELGKSTGEGLANIRRNLDLWDDETWREIKPKLVHKIANPEILQEQLTDSMFATVMSEAEFRYIISRIRNTVGSTYRKTWQSILEETERRLLENNGQ